MSSSTAPPPKKARPKRSSTAAPGPAEGRRKLPYDRAFEASVRAGRLSVQEAIQRGNRDVYAAKIARRHHLPRELALRVADNRIRLFEAMRQCGRIAGHPAPPPAGAGPARWQLVTLICGCVVLCSLLGLHLWQRQGRAARQLEEMSISRGQPDAQSDAQPTRAVPVRAPDRGERARVERDELGRVTRVSSSHPSEVLAAFCAAAAAPGGCVSAEIRPTDPQFPGRRLGTFRLARALDESRVLSIQRDRRSGRWYAGTGLAPILPDTAQGDAEANGEPEGDLEWSEEAGSAEFDETSASG